jgi:hypothetical protein
MRHKTSENYDRPRNTAAARLASFALDGLCTEEQAETLADSREHRTRGVAQVIAMDGLLRSEAASNVESDWRRRNRWLEACLEFEELERKARARSWHHEIRWGRCIKAGVACVALCLAAGYFAEYSKLNNESIQKATVPLPTKSTKAAEKSSK